MERWESLVEGYPPAPTLRDFSKAVESAKVVLKEDLAPFEIDWLLQTLLASPVNLLQSLSSHYHDDAWSNVCGRSLELVTVLVTDHTTHVQEYMEDIVKRCAHPYSVHTRKRALQCLRGAAARAPGRAWRAAWPRLRAALAAGEPAAARAVRAHLVGTICEHHPELLGEGEETQIWRLYLTILEASKTTDSLINGVLLGLNGLFKHFGQNLPTSDLNNFYDKLSGKYLLIPSCQEACFQLLANHPRLFPERLAGGGALRARLWAGLGAGAGRGAGRGAGPGCAGAAAALVAVYGVCVTPGTVQIFECKIKMSDFLQSLNYNATEELLSSEIITTELYPRTASTAAQESNAAHRIMANVLRHHDHCGLTDIRKAFDKQVSSLCTSLEFSLAAKVAAAATGGKWEYDHNLAILVQQAAWCIESGQAGSDALLRSVLLLYPQIAPARRRKLVVHTLLHAADGLRTAAVTFLISESCASPDHEPATPAYHHQLWQEIFDTQGGKDLVVTEKSRLVFNDLLAYILFVMGAFADGRLEGERASERLSSLLHFSSRIIQIEIVRGYLPDYVESLLGLTLDCSEKYGLSAGLVQFMAALLFAADEACMLEDGTLPEELVEDLRGFYQSLRIDRCSDEALLCASCLALTQAPDSIGDVATRLQALQVVFSRADVEPATLSQALRKLESLLSDEGADELGHLVSDIVSMVAKLATRAATNAAGRVLRRDTLMFLGRRGSGAGAARAAAGDRAVNRLEGMLLLSLPNAQDGTTLKINLKRTLRLALTHEDPKALHSLMLILITNLAVKPEPVLQEALSLVICQLSRCHGRGETDAGGLEQAVSFCRSVECVRSFIQHLTAERSPGVRKILSRVLETLLQQDPHSGTSERALGLLAEQAGLMMGSRDRVTKRAGLDLVETIVAALRENDKLSVDFIPNLLISVLKTDERDFEIAYEIASTHFLDKMVLFKEEALENTAKHLLGSVDAICDEVNLKLAVGVCMGTFKNIARDAKWNMANKFFEIFAQIFKEQPQDAMAKVKYLLLLTKAKEILEFDAETSRKVISTNDFLLFKVVKDLLDQKGDIYSETVFKTLGEYAEVSMEVKYVMTIDYLGQAIAKLSPKCIKRHHKTIEETLKVYQQLWNNTPQAVVNGFRAWCQKLPIKTITENVERRCFPPKQAVIITAMRKLFGMMHLPDLPTVLLEFQDDIRKWPNFLMHCFASGYSSDLFKSKMADLNDILTVSFHFMTAAEVAEMALEGWSVRGMTNEKIGYRFCQHFIGAFAPCLLSKGVLSKGEMDRCAILVHDLVKYCSKYNPEEDVCKNVSDLVQQLWPSLKSTQTFNELHCILIDISAMNASLTLDSNPGLWWLDAMSGSTDDERVRLMTSLPVFLQDGVADGCRERYFSALQMYSGFVPRRLPPSSPAEPLVLALLHAVARTGEERLLELMMTCVAHDAPPQWLDAALRNAMAAMAAKQDAAILEAVHTLCDRDELSVALYERVLVPLIRHSSSAVCMKFFSSRLPAVLAALWKRPRCNPPPRGTVARLARALALAAAAFEKLPLPELQAPSSSLYSRLELKQSATLAQELCKLCAALRSQVQCPEDADEELRTAIRCFHTSNFNCLATVLCRTRAAGRFFESSLQPGVLAALVDTRATCPLHIQPQGRVSTVHRAAPESVDPDAPLTARGSVLATRTLSDNPLAYDFLNAQAEEQVSPPTVALPDNALNGHPCAGTLTAAARHLAALGPRIGSLEALLHDEGLHARVRWLLAQIVINCKQELTEHSYYLTPCLLRVVATTPYDSQGLLLINGLHVNALNTIAQWTEEAKEKPTLTQTDKAHIQTIFDLLLATCVHHKSWLYVFKTCMNTLNGFLKLYGEFLHGKWAFFEEVLKDKSNETACLEMLIAVTRNKVHIPELLSNVLAKLESKQYLANKLAGTAELFGLALAASGSKDLGKFWKVLERLRISNSQDYVKLLFYAQSGCKECCNEINFRHITDLTPKMVREQKSKCFEIITAYIARFDHPNEYITDMFESVDLCEAIATGDHRVQALKVARAGLRLMPAPLQRRVVFLAGEVSCDGAARVRGAAQGALAEAFTDLFAPAPHAPAAKRPRGRPASRLLRVLAADDLYGRVVAAAVGRGLADRDEVVRAAVGEGVAAALCDTDLATRFSEVLLLTVTLPATVPAAGTSSPAAGTARPPVDVARTLSVALGLLFQGLAGSEAFKRLRLREEPLEVASGRSAAGPSKLLTMSRSYQGTFRRHVSGTSGSKKASKTKTSPASSLDVQVPLTLMLESLLEFSRSGPEAAAVVLLDTARALQADPGPGAEPGLDLELAAQVAQVLERGQVDELTPVVLQLGRLCVRECCVLESFEPSVLNVKALTAHTSGEGISSLLYEEVLMTGAAHGVGALGADRADDDVEDMGDESAQFSIEALEAIFTRLCDWGQLTLRQKRSVENAVSTPLWAVEDRFREVLEGSRVTTEWLSKMRQSLDQSSTVDHYRWLRGLDRWPGRPFAISAITEAIEWHSLVFEQDMKRLPHVIKSADCLAEWAARFMMRSTYLSAAFPDRDSDSEAVTSRRGRSRAQELAWCMEANGRGLPSLALQCVKRNSQELLQSETLGWLQQQVRAMRALGLRGGRPMLQKALLKTETFAQEYRDHSPPHVLLSMDTLQLQLNADLESLTTEKIDAILGHCWGKRDVLLKHRSYGTENRKNFVAMCEIAVCYYEESWEQCYDITEHDQVITQLAGCLAKAADVGSSAEVESFASVLLNKLDQYLGDQLPDAVAEEVLATMDGLADSLNEFLVLELQRLEHRFPAPILARSKLRTKLAPSSRDAPKLWLQLVCDPDYALRQYVEDLAQWLNEGDQEAWEATFGRMEHLLDNPHAGTAFQLLAKHRPALNEIKNYEIFKDYQTNARQTLRTIHSQLSSQEAKVALNLAQLCPALATYSLSGGEGDADSLAEVLGLKAGVSVVRFERQVLVIAGSVRRPCVLRALLSDGRSQRHLVKRGEPLRMDAAAARAQRMFCKRAGFADRGYNVTPLSDDCALIEYLEDHVTLRSMIPQAAEILRTVRRPDDGELILASAASTLKQFEDICRRVPAGTLRSTMEEKSLSVEDFLQKRHTFTDSLGAVTICHWILGVGDRHLENYLCSGESGAAVAIDWGSVLGRGLEPRAPELAPARLTRTLLAVGSPSVLESRLESMLGALRSSWRLTLPTLRVLFRWRPDHGRDGQRKMKYIEDILRGKALPYHITRCALEDTVLVQNADKYVQLLDGIFEGLPVKEQYDVEDQVSCLLRQCTDPRILSVTRSGWEPWL